MKTSSLALYLAGGRLAWRSQRNRSSPELSVAASGANQRGAQHQRNLRENIAEEGNIGRHRAEGKRRRRPRRSAVSERKSSEIISIAARWYIMSYQALSRYGGIEHRSYQRIGGA